MTWKEVVAGLPATVFDAVDARAVEAIRRSVTGDNGQTLHSSLLVGCPFCGCATPFVQTWALGDLSWEARVVCGTCHVATSAECQSWRVRIEGGEDVTRLVAVGRAIASWNRRA